MHKIKLALHWQMIIAMVLGVLMGWLLGGYYLFWGDFVNGIGQIFIHAINMIVIPLVFLSTLLSISKINDTRSMGSVALKSFLYFIVTSVLAASLGVLVTVFLRPGFGACCPDDIDATMITNQANEVKQVTFMDQLVEIIPKNVFEAFAEGYILPIIFFSIMLGFFITKLKDDRRNMLNGLFESLNDVFVNMTNFIIRFAPVGVFAIVMGLIGERAGEIAVLKSIFVKFAYFVIVIWVVLIIVGGIILPLIVGLVARVSPIKHLKQVYSALLLAFSTCSSYSALPMLISDAKDKIGVSNKIASFTIPLGITFNKIGTIIYECVAVIFVAQVWEVELTIAQQVSIVLTSIVTVMGAPSVPMSGVLVLAILLKLMDLPDTCIGMFMAIDILCDMPKTLLNAYSMSCGAVVVAKSEDEELKI